MKQPLEICNFIRVSRDERLELYACIYENGDMLRYIFIFEMLKLLYDLTFELALLMHWQQQIHRKMRT